MVTRTILPSESSTTSAVCRSITSALPLPVARLDLDAAASSLCLHANEDDNRVAGVNELLRLDAPCSPRGSPLLKPACHACMSAINTLVRGVVVIDLDILVKHLPLRLARRDEAGEASLDKFYVLLRHRLLCQPSGFEGLAV